MKAKVMGWNGMEWYGDDWLAVPVSRARAGHLAN